MHENERDHDEFAIDQGGIIYRVFVRLSLAATDVPSAWKASIGYALIAWFPLIILSLIQYIVMGISPQFPLFHDLLVYMRLFVVLIVFLAAARYVKPSIAMVVNEFRRSGIVRREDLAQYFAILTSAKRWRDSPLADIIMILAAYTGAYFGLRAEWNDQASTWMAITVDGRERLTLAGWWYLLVTIPLFQLLLYRWLWRLLVWYRMLWGIVRLPLQLIPTHPDLMGGIGFINIGHIGFAVLIFAVSAIISASVGNRYLYQNIHPPAYLTMFLSVITILLIVFLVPLLMFTPHLIRVKRQGLFDYGFLAAKYVRAFTEKWEDERAPVPDHLLGNADFQSLADLANGYNIVKKMRLIPIEINTLFFYVLMAFIPIVPLLFTVRTVQDIINTLFRLILP